MENKILILIFAIIFISLVSGNCEEGQININNASAEELDKIIWVGSATAQNIINSRPFSSLEDLLNVSGIGETKLQDIKEQGLACVEEQEIIENNKEQKEKEVIYVKFNPEKSSLKNIKQTININPKDINTKKNNSNLINSEYALYGFIIFSLLIILLSILKINKNKNEFE